MLIRALEPSAGMEEMRARRGDAARTTDLCSGPGKLTQALGIGLAENGADLCRDPFLILPPEDGARPRGPHRPADRDHEGRRAPLALLRRGPPYVSRPRPPKAGPRHRL